MKDRHSIDNKTVFMKADSTTGTIRNASHRVHSIDDVILYKIVNQSSPHISEQSSNDDIPLLELELYGNNINLPNAMHHVFLSYITLLRDLIYAMSYLGLDSTTHDTQIIM